MSSGNGSGGAGAEKMRVLVTGSSGFLGSHVAEQLSKAGHTVVALVRKTSNRKFLEKLESVVFAEGTVEDRDSVERAMDGVDAVIHSAGIVKARNDAEFHATNVKGTTNMIEGAAAVCASRIKRFVHVSSLEASGPSHDGNPVPVEQEMPVTRYGKSKLAAEKEVLKHKERLPVTILRPTGIYGPRDAEMFEIFKSVKRGVLPITGDGTGQVTLVYGPDAARACIRAIDASVPSGSRFFITDGGVYEQRAMMEEVERALAKRALVRFGLPHSVIQTVSVFVEAYGKLRDKPVMLTRDKAAGLTHKYWTASSDDAQKALDWTPEVRWDEGTKLTAQWYRDNGWL
jgi:nucleoside-diphosphate-sugar epimerase